MLPTPAARSDICQWLFTTNLACPRFQDFYEVRHSLGSHNLVDSCSELRINMVTTVYGSGCRVILPSEGILMSLHCTKLAATRTGSTSFFSLPTPPHFQLVSCAFHGVCTHKYSRHFSEKTFFEPHCRAALVKPKVSYHNKMTLSEADFHFVILVVRCLEQPLVVRWICTALLVG